MTAKQSDKSLGIKTSGTIPITDFGINHLNVSNARRYEATPYDVLEDMLLDIRADYQDFVFIDLGSGKGRVALLAGQLPFKKVVGVEFVPKLVRQARANLETVRSADILCTDVEFVQGDAAEYEFPKLPIVLYLFNPFNEAVLRQVLENLRRSLSEKPRSAFVMYYMPEFTECFADFPEFREIAASRDWSIFQREDSLT